MRRLTRRDALRGSALALAGLAGCLEGADPPAGQQPVDSTTDGGTATPSTADHERVAWRRTGDRVSRFVYDQGALFTASYWHVRRRAPTDGSGTWTHQLAERSDAICHDGGLAVGSEFVFATGCDGVQALARDDGSEQWTSDAVETIKSPAVAGDLLYCSGDERVTCLATTDGSEQWSAAVGDEATPSRPAVEDGVAYVGGDDGVVRAVDAGDGSGQVRWTYETASRRAHVPTAVDGTVYVGTSDPETDAGALLALDADGTRQWRVETTQTLAGSRPVVTDDTVYLGSASGTLAAHARDDGSRRWGFDADDWLVSQPAVDPGANTLYCGSNDGHCYAVDTTDGTQRWSVPVGYGNTAPAFDDRRVYVPTSQGLYALTRD